jgi:hypothetical protein
VKDSRPLPPFAREIDRFDDLVMVYCGQHAYEFARPNRPFRVASLAFPRRADPSAYRWPVRGKQVLVFGKDEPRAAIDALVMELLQQGAYRVMTYCKREFVDYDQRTRRRA